MEEYDILNRHTGQHEGRMLLDRMQVEGVARVHHWCVFYGTLSGEVIYHPAPR